MASREAPLPRKGASVRSGPLASAPGVNSRPYRTIGAMWCMAFSTYRAANSATALASSSVTGR
jgi:hypothetical protein